MLVVVKLSVMAGAVLVGAGELEVWSRVDALGDSTVPGDCGVGDEGVEDVEGRGRVEGDATGLGEESVEAGRSVEGADRVEVVRVSGWTVDDSEDVEGRDEVVAVDWRGVGVEVENGGMGRVERAEDGSAVLLGSLGVACRRTTSTCVLLRRAKPVRESKLSFLAPIPSSTALPLPFSSRLILLCI